MQLSSFIKNSINRLARFRENLRRPRKRHNHRLLAERNESIDSFTFREAIVDDIKELAALHVKTWNETFHRVSKPHSDNMREYQWREQFKIADDSWFCYVIANQQNELIGFGFAKRYTSAELPDYGGELNNIFLLEQYQRMGLGRKLAGYIARRFLNMGVSSMILFGEPGNPSSFFHEAIGGKKLFSKTGAFYGSYGWKDLRTVAKY